MRTKLLLLKLLIWRILSSSLTRVSELFKEKVAVVRQGKFTPSVLEEIIVKTHDHTDEPLKNIARVASKGPRTLTITVFDPHNVKHITAAVIGSDLNLNPQPDPKSPEQVLRVPLPPATAESKKEIIKQLRHEYEHFRNSAAKKSLTGIREHALKAIRRRLERPCPRMKPSRLKITLKSYSRLAPRIWPMRSSRLRQLLLRSKLVTVYSFFFLFKHTCRIIYR